MGNAIFAIFEGYQKEEKAVYESGKCNLTLLR